MAGTQIPGRFAAFLNALADGFELTWGTVARKLKLTGGDVTITGDGTTNTKTFPSGVHTMVSQTSTDLLANKTFDKFNTNSQIITGIPAAPATDILTWFSRKRAGRGLISSIGPSGLDVAYQPFMGGNKVGLWQAAGGNSTVISTWGFNTWTQIITATARALATTNALTASRRLGFVSAATIGLNTGMFHPSQITYLSTGQINLGGFYFVVRFGLPVLASTGPRFCGDAFAAGCPSSHNRTLGTDRRLCRTCCR
jgi:hypothetical protein